MGDSSRYRPRSAYAQPGEIDTSLVEAESLRPRPAAKADQNRATLTPRSSIPESRPTAPRPVAEWERESLVSGHAAGHAAESKPSPLRPNPATDPFYKGLAPAGNVEPSRKGLAPAPGVVEGKAATIHLGIDAGLSRGNPALQRGLAPPPGIASTPAVPLRPVHIHTPIFERKPAPPPPPRPELKPVIENPEPVKIPTLSPPRRPLARQGVSARFELLPDAKPRWNQLGLSAAGQLVILGLALLSPILFPQTMKTALRFDVIELMQPVTEIPVAPETPKPPAPRPPPKPKPKAKVEPKAPELKPEVPEPPPLVPQLSPKQPHAFLILKPLVTKAHTVEVKPLEAEAKPEATRDCAVVERSKSSQGRSEAQSRSRQSWAGHSECRIEQSADRRIWRPKRNRRTGKSEPARQHQPGRLARFAGRSGLWQRHWRRARSARHGGFGWLRAWRRRGRKRFGWCEYSVQAKAPLFRRRA